jgi:hypothetical protein
MHTLFEDIVGISEINIKLHFHLFYSDACNFTVSGKFLAFL